MNKAKISEIFFSLQGEGPYLGTGHVFLRFCGCNLKCGFCDTRQGRFKEFTPAGLAKATAGILSKNPAGFLSLTGGEPLLWHEFIFEFLNKFKRKNLAAYLETNGVLYRNFAEIKDKIDVVAMDLKLPSATGCASFWKEHEMFLREARGKRLFLKSVITMSALETDLKKASNLIRKFDKNLIFVLQPNHFELSDELTSKLFRFQRIAGRILKDVRIIPQIHKYMGVR